MNGVGCLPFFQQVKRDQCSTEVTCRVLNKQKSHSINQPLEPCLLTCTYYFVLWFLCYLLRGTISLTFYDPNTVCSTILPSLWSSIRR